MKRTVSILLAALLLLFALPTFAEGEGLQPGLYISEEGSDVLYLDAAGVGVLNYVSDENFVANGVVWTGTSLEIERVKTPYALLNGALIFTFDDAVRTFRLANAGEGYALGDRAGTAFAGAYAAEDGRTLTLTADGRGVYGDAAGETPVYWGSLAPYWAGAVTETDGVCFILFDSFLSGLTFVDGAAIVSTGTEGDISFQPVAIAAAEPTPVSEEQLQAGLYVSDAGTDLMYLNEEGVGVMNCTMNGSLYSNGVVWTESGLTIERVETPVGFLDGVLCFTYGGAVRFLRYRGVSEQFALGDKEGMNFAGEYTAADGKKLSLMADGRGAYRDESGERPVFWGSYLSYFDGFEGLTEGSCYLLFDSYMTMLTFTDDTAVLVTEAGEQIVLRRSAAATAPTEAAAGEDRLYYGYRVTMDGQTFDVIPFLTAMGMDPRTIRLTLRADGTGTLLYDGNREDFTWDDTSFTSAGESIPYAWEGDHIILTETDEILEFAPAEEFEALLADAQPLEQQAAVTEERQEMAASAADALVGTWTFVRARAMGMDIPASMMGGSMSLVLNADGSAVLDGSDGELAWTLREDGSVALLAAEEEVFVLAYDGATLTIDTGVDGVVMIFEKDA